MDSYKKIPKYRHSSLKAFTLVELIVVITILVILGTIALISLTGYTSSARDSTRLSDLKSIKTSLEIFAIRSGSYPLPSNPAHTVTYENNTVFLEGTAGDSVIRALSVLSKKPADPKYGVDYTYSVTPNGKEYQLSAVLEDGSRIWGYFPPPFIEQTFAAEYPIAYVIGNYNGLSANVQGTSVQLALPTITTSDNRSGSIDITTIASGSFVFDRQTNMPFTYQLPIASPAAMVTFVPKGTGTGGWVAYSWSIKTSADLSALVSSLQSAYSGTILSQNNINTRVTFLLAATGSEAIALIRNIPSVANTSITPWPLPVNGTCGTASGVYSAVTPTTNLCSVGTPSVVVDKGIGSTYDWTCAGQDGGSTPICKAGHDPYFSSSKLLVHFDEAAGTPASVIDTKGHLNTLYSPGSIASWGRFWNYLPWGYVDFAYHTDWSFGSGDATVEFWYKSNSSTISDWAQMVYRNVGLNDNNWSIRTGADKTLFMDIAGIGMGQKSSVIANMNDMNWHHVAVSKIGTTSIKMFWDGNLVNTFTPSTSAQFNDSTANIRIGTYGWVHSIDDVRITKGIARYTAAFTPPSGPFADF